MPFALHMVHSSLLPFIWAALYLELAFIVNPESPSVTPSVCLSVCLFPLNIQPVFNLHRGSIGLIGGSEEQHQ